METAGGAITTWWQPFCWLLEFVPYGFYTIHCSYFHGFLLQLTADFFDWHTTCRQTMCGSFFHLIKCAKFKTNGRRWFFTVYDTIQSFSLFSDLWYCTQESVIFSWWIIALLKFYSLNGWRLMHLYIIFAATWNLCVEFHEECVQKVQAIFHEACSSLWSAYCTGSVCDEIEVFKWGVSIHIFIK